MAVGNLVKQLQDIMRKDSGISGDAQRIEQMVWVIFLKVYDSMEEDWELDDDDYESIIPEQLRWRNWAHSKDEDGKEIASITGDALLDFVNNKLFPILKGRDFGEKPMEKKDGEKEDKDEKPKEYIPGIKVTRETPPHQAIVYEVFREVNQYMKDGVQLRQLIDKIDEVDLLDSEEAHTFGNIYESILKDLQGAGNAGEFYTPRAVTDFIIKMLAPQLGEVVGDFAMGTGGFLVSALEYLEKERDATGDYEKWQHSILGQEWKPFPYLLAVTNVLLHGIKDPDLSHMDSLGKSMSDYEEEGKVNVIAMNPPYGGATSSSTKNNFKAEYRSSETADLFMVLIMQRLAEDGRAGVIVPDGFLFGTDGAKLAIKRRMFKEFNVHTIIRLPGSVFSPYTSIATNIIFFNNEKADGAPEGFNTAQTWFYRLDKPEGYINFSRKKPMLLSHFDEVVEWWNDRKVVDDGEKSQCFTSDEIEAGSYNLDLCKFPKEEEVILDPKQTMVEYLAKSEEYYNQIRNSFNNLLNLLQGKQERLEYEKTVLNPWKELADISASLPEKLKKSILQEAIMGNLGTQDPNDKPASDLLEKVRAKKKELAKDGVLKKKDLVERPVEVDDVLFKIPEGWEWCKIDTLFQHSSGKQLKGGDIKGELHQYITTSNLYWDRFVLDNLKSMFYKASELARYTATKGDLLVCEGGDVGRCAIWPYEYDICLQNHVHRLRPYYNFNTRYIMYTFMLYKAKGYIGGKGIGIKGFSASALKDINIPLPPLAEQHRIVEKIEALFAEIDNMTINNNDINETKTGERKE